jgi:hypothetical protein
LGFLGSGGLFASSSGETSNVREELGAGACDAWAGASPRTCASRRSLEACGESPGDWGIIGIPRLPARLHPASETTDATNKQIVTNFVLKDSPRIMK